MIRDLLYDISIFLIPLLVCVSLDSGIQDEEYHLIRILYLWDSIIFYAALIIGMLIRHFMRYEGQVSSMEVVFLKANKIEEQTQWPRH